MPTVFKVYKYSLWVFKNTFLSFYSFMRFIKSMFINWIESHFGPGNTYRLMYKKRCDISLFLSEKFERTVAYGPFKGFNLGNGYKWGQADVGNMLLGIYESEVLKSLLDKPSDYKTFIDIGAADGYFAIGSLVGNLFDKTYCFELSEESRKNIKFNATLNGVQDRIDINCGASSSFYKDLISKEVNLSHCVILCDIEGAEFGLFDDAVLNGLKKSILIIEIHDWHENGIERFKELKSRAMPYFEINEIRTGSRDLSIFPEVAGLRDDDRWLLCSEGRHHLMTWLRLDPKVKLN